jgi:hypothetical protein
MAGHVYAPEAQLDSNEIAAIEKVSKDYWDAWYTADDDLLDGCLHPDFELRGLVRRMLETSTSYIATEVVRKSEVHLDLGSGVDSTDPNGRINEVTVLAATHHVASVKAVGQGQIHLLHLLRFPDGWRIVDGIWAFDGGVIANAIYDM